MKEVLREIEAIARCSEAISSIEFKHLKLSRGLDLYLTFVCEYPGEPAGTVADRLKVKRAAASRALGKLADDGLIELREAPNLRKDKRVYPTETGKSAYLFIRDEGEYADESSLRGLSPEEIPQLLDMLYRVRVNVEKDWRFVQKGGRRPYIHDYYNRLIAAGPETDGEPGSGPPDSGGRGGPDLFSASPDTGGQRSAAGPPQAPAASDGEREVSLWTYEESREQARREAEERAKRRQDAEKAGPDERG